MSDMRRRPATTAPVRISAQTAARAAAAPPRPASAPRAASRTRFAGRATTPARAWWWRPKVIAAAALVAIGYFALTSHRTVSSQADKPAAVKYTKTETICLDPGHGGADPGAVNGTLTERDINLTVGLKVHSLLQAKGYQVFMTRTTNVPNLANADRYNYCNSKHATILVSIHHNFFTDSTVDHDSALYFKPADQALAATIVAATSAKLGLLNNGIAQFEDGVLSKSAMPAALSEAFFLTSTKESRSLRAAGSTRLADEAAGIAAGIENYFTPSAAATPAPSSAPQVLNRDE